MATKIGDLFFEVFADTGPAVSSITAMDAAASASASLISSALVTAFDAVAFAAKSAVAFIINDVIEMGAQFNIAGQKAVGLFTALTGSADDALDLMREFSQLSIDAPLFDPETLSKTASLLLTFGIAKDDVLDLAKNVNLAAIALGKGQGGAIQLARALGQVNSAGRLLGGEARQLSEVGINAYQLMADELGITIAEVKKLGRENKLLASDVLPVVEAHIAKTFGPVAQNMLGTFGVQAQGLRNIFTDIGSAIVEPFIGRATGGVLTDFLADVREELVGVIEVAEDGSFVLTGALAPITAVTEALAAGFTKVGDAFIGWLSEEGRGDGLEDFMEGLADAIPGLVDGFLAFASGAGDFFSGLYDALEPLGEIAFDELKGFFGYIVDVLPDLADGIVTMVEIAAPFAEILLQIGGVMMDVFGPLLVATVEALAGALELVSNNLGLVTGVALSFAGAWAVVNTTLVMVTAQLKLGAIALGSYAVAAALAFAALQSLSALNHAMDGDVSWLNEDVPWYEKPFQLAGRAGYDLGGTFTGNEREQQIPVDELNAATVAAEEFNLKLLAGIETFAEARKEALTYAAALDLNANEASHFANLVALAWDTATKEADAAAEAEAAAAQAIEDAFQDTLRTYSVFASGITTATEGMMRIFSGSNMSNISWIEVPLIEEAADLVKFLEGAAKSAAAAVDDLLAPDAEATLDDFLRSLPDLAENLTKALKANDGTILSGLEISGILDDVGDKARKVIGTLVDDYGLSIEEIVEMLGKNGGLEAVIEALTNQVGEAVKAVDPLIQKFLDLGYTASAVNEAIDLLKSQRTDELQAQIDFVTSALESARDTAQKAKDAIKTQIDAVTKSLQAAKEAAKEAKQALEDYFKGDTGGLQGAIDSLVLDIPDIGSDIEAALRKGGPQGEAGIRQALAGVGSGLGEIFQLGLEEGLSPEEIIAMLGPVYASIQQEIGGAMNRISSLDWEEGFTPKAAQQIKDWLAGILDPAQIAELFTDITSGDALVGGLQGQLDALNTQLDAVVVINEVEFQATLDALNAEKEIDPVFTQEDIQGAIDELYPPDLQVQPVVTEEAAQAIMDEIQGILASDELALAIDEQNLTQQIVDIAQAAANTVQLDFNSNLVFDEEMLGVMADVLGGSFAEKFKAGIAEALREDKPEGGNQWWIPGSSHAGDVGGNGTNVTVNNDITINGAKDPPASGSAVVSMSSASAGSGGRIYSSPWAQIYGAPK